MIIGFEIILVFESNLKISFNLETLGTVLVGNLRFDDTNRTECGVVVIVNKLYKDSFCTFILFYVSMRLSCCYFPYSYVAFTD